MRSRHSNRARTLACIAALSFALPASAQLPLGSQYYQKPNDFNFVGNSFGIPGLNGSFDYVVIGGGTAGLVMAHRLAESKNTVAVIEAGGFYEVDNGNFSVLPPNCVFFTGASLEDTQPLVDWSFATVPQTAVNNRVVHYSRGKTLGGSSARNYLAYQRGTSGSYDMWATEVGDSAYTWPEFLPYFQKSVNFTPANNAVRAANASVSYNESAFSEHGGPLRVTFANWANPFSSWFKKALNGLGLEDALDMVSGTLHGVSYQMNTLSPQDFTRDSSESSFLRQGLSTQTNLQVYKNTLAKRILFDGKRACGVLVNTAGATYRLNATKEVILSAGAFQSPQMLMVSGIGPRETLDKFDIPIVAELPGVGQQLWDQFFVGQTYRVDVTTHAQLGSNPEFAAAAGQQYRENATGIMTNSGADVFGWQKIPAVDRATALSASTLAELAKFPADWPELEYIALDAYAGDLQNFLTGSPKTPYNYVGIYSALVAPLSRGNISISSADAADQPLINPGWLTNPGDLEVALYAFKRMRQIMASPTLKDVNLGEVFPGTNYTTDAEIMDAIKNFGFTLYHASATCKMGKTSDPQAVVDSHARVLGGVKGLRVVDASAFPFLPPGHPQATVYALAERIAQFMLDGQ